VQFYCLFDSRAFALVSVYSEPDSQILKDSSGALYVCRYMGEAALRLVRVEEIQALVSMQLLPAVDHSERGLMFPVHKPGIGESMIEEPGEEAG
jgi:hypothetical protein